MTEKQKRIARTLAMLREKETGTAPPATAIIVNNLNVSLTIDCDPDAPVRPIWYLGRVG